MKMLMKTKQAFEIRQGLRDNFSAKRETSTD